MPVHYLATAETFQNYQDTVYETRANSRVSSDLLEGLSRRSRWDMCVLFPSLCDRGTSSRCPSTAPEPMANLVSQQVQASVPVITS